ncbi:MAG: ABC transporter substrate-binding protein [Gemmatimonadota bacterium]|nr:MAG: ABC transporter substrate-binding protein [Gemmatimonadota bacterium]
MRWIWIPWVGVSLSCYAAGHATTTAGDPDSVPTVLDTPVDFSGFRGVAADAARLDEVRIGLFAPMDERDPVGSHMYRAAQLAVEQLNASGGFEGVPLRIVTRWDDDPWRGGSKQMIRLVYEDSVWAVIGSVNGDATHVAEQVVTKAWLPLVSPVSADPTLTYIRIPWIFRLPPDDRVQAQAVVRDGMLKLRLERVGLITSTDHDGRVFAEEMLGQMHAAASPPLFHLQLSLQDLDYDQITRRVRSFQPGGIVMRLPLAEVPALLEQLRNGDVTVPVLLPWIPGAEISEFQGRYDGTILSVMPFAAADNSRYARFARAYRDRYGVHPTPTAAYTYDAVNLVVQSLEESGLNRTTLRDAIAGGSGYEGVTGVIRWDNAGGNRAQAVLVGSR